ncbi:hypothetical protein [Lysobacter capsici]|uniref:hypothetical protein n=1 Tax=Lysobacter capsici TaxID=435897 RepID=UPI000627F106|nr:hypothetical protein [Lysobacter capsici]
MIKPTSIAAAALLPRHNATPREGGSDFSRWIGSDQGRAPASDAPDAQSDAQRESRAAGDIDAPSLAFDLAMADKADLLLEFHVSGRGGDQELLALPWRLSANGRLSQLLSATPRPDGQGLASSPARDAATRANASLADAWVEYSIRHLAQADAASPQVLPMPNLADPLQSSAASSGESTASASAPRNASDGAAAPWAARLLRWIESEGGDATLWIRDYRLDPDAAQRLSRLMHTLAEEHGTQLQRIVVNGREHWRADRNSSQENL